MITYILPTRNRPERLAATLEAIGMLGDHKSVGGAEVIVVDNDSSPPAWAPSWLHSGVPVKLLRRKENEGAAARNAAVKTADPATEWVVMLDDDSHPLDTGVIEAIKDAPAEVAAIAAEIYLPMDAAGPTTSGASPDNEPRVLESGLTLCRHESGGLPEVFIGCGVAIRRKAYEQLGGYDPTFDYYAEEYDLAAKMMAAGYRIAFDRRFRVMHHKIAQGRDFKRIVRRLVRNNAWVAQRYAPDAVRQHEIRETVTRYAKIARKERALSGYMLGMWDLAMTLRSQPRTPMTAAMYDRLTGLAAARTALAAAHAKQELGRVAIVERGKNAWAVERVLHEMGATLVSEEAKAQTLVIGTMSPGPMLDAVSRRLGVLHDGKRVVAPWVEADRELARTARRAKAAERTTAVA